MATNPEVYTVDQAEEDIADTRGIVDTLGEVHTLSDGSVVPNTPGAGQVSHFVTAGIPQFINPQGLQLNLVGAGGPAAVGPVVVTAGPTNIATFLVPPLDCVPGAVYRVTTFGFGTTGSTAASNVLTFDMTHGGVASGGSVALGSSLFGTNTGFRWFMQGILVCITNGVGGTFYAYAMITANPSTGNILPTTVQAAGIATGGAATFTVDTTVNETFRLRAAWAASTGSPTLTAVTSFAERVA